MKLKEHIARVAEAALAREEAEHVAMQADRAAREATGRHRRAYSALQGALEERVEQEVRGTALPDLDGFTPDPDCNCKCDRDGGGVRIEIEDGDLDEEELAERCRADFAASDTDRRG